MKRGRRICPVPFIERSRSVLFGPVRKRSATKEFVALEIRLRQAAAAAPSYSPDMFGVPWQKIISAIRPSPIYYGRPHHLQK